MSSFTYLSTSYKRHSVKVSVQFALNNRGNVGSAIITPTLLQDTSATYFSW